MKDEKVQLGQEKDALEQAQAEFSNEITSLKAANEKEQTKLADSELKWREVCVQHETTRTELQEKIDQLAALQERCDFATKEVSLFTTKIETMTAENGQLQDKNAQLESKAKLLDDFREEVFLLKFDPKK